jgi:ABC-2 type transport system ATP-binding protein
VQIKYDGDSQFLKDPKLVHSFNDYGNYVEVRLAAGADPQDLLRAAASHARVNKFELMEPSLEEIFIEAVGKADA